MNEICNWVIGTSIGLLISYIALSLCNEYHYRKERKKISERFEYFKRLHD